MTNSIVNFNIFYWVNINLVLVEILLSVFLVLNILLITSAFFKNKSTNISNRLQIIPAMLDINIVGILLCLLLLILKVIEYVIIYFRVFVETHGLNATITFGIEGETQKGIPLIAYINDTLQINNYTQFVKILLFITGISILLSAQKFLKYKKNITLEYPLLIQLGLFFLLIIISTYSLISFFLGIFGVSIILYIILAINKNAHSSREAAIKYFLLSAISSGLFCYSIFLILLIYKTTFFYTINLISTIFLMNYWNSDVYNYSLITNFYIVVIFLIACFFKLGAYPSHLWTVEIYQGSSTPVMAFFIMPVKLVLFSVISKILIDVLDSLQWIWSLLVWLSSLFSLIWGCFGALIEQDFKKFLAFSSINQMGFLLMGISCVSFEAFRSTIIYLTIYMLTNLILFPIFMSITTNLINTRLMYLQELNMFSKTNFKLSMFLAISMFSIAGIPPLAGFFGKFFLFLHAFEMNSFLIVVIAMFTSLLSAFYYLNIINNMWFLKSYNNIRYNIEMEPLNYCLVVISVTILIIFILLQKLVITLNIFDVFFTEALIRNTNEDEKYELVWIYTLFL